MTGPAAPQTNAFNKQREAARALYDLALQQVTPGFGGDPDEERVLHQLICTAHAVNSVATVSAEDASMPVALNAQILAVLVACRMGGSSDRQIVDMFAEKVGDLSELADEIIIQHRTNTA